jgi:hypothetical protein
VSFRGIETASRSSLYLSARGEGESKPLHPAIPYKSSSALDRWEHLRIVILPCGANHSVGDIITAEVELMVKYALLSLGVAGLLMLGEGLAPQVTWPTGQQERFVVRVPEDFPTIQTAIDAVAEGGTVLIGPGEYRENIQITKSLHVIGSDQERVRIYGLDDQKPVVYVRSQFPLQLFLQRLTITREHLPDPNLPPSFIPPGTGIFLGGPIQAAFRQLTVTNQISGVVAFPLLEYNEELLYFQPQVILEEVSLAHNGGAVLALSTHLIIVRSNISENELGIMGDSIYLTHSTVRKNRFWGIDLHLPSSVFSPQYLGALQNNEISENGVGVILGAIAEDAAGSWLRMDENKIVHNQEYGVMILKSVCPTSPPHPELALGRESAFIRIFGGNNELHDNLQGDLCPADYPWPPGFRK